MRKLKSKETRALTFANSVVAGASRLQRATSERRKDRERERERDEDGETRWSREGWQDMGGKVGARGWRSEFMAALSLYRPCRVSFSREEGRISR